MQKSIIYIALLIVSTMLFSSCSLFSARYSKVEKGEYKISAAGKKRFSLNNVNGKIKVVKTTDQTSIIVKYEKTAHVKKRDLGGPMTEITLNIDSSGTDVKIDTDFENERSILQLGGHETNTVDYEIYIPENILVNLDNTNGSIDLNELTNDVKAETINGTIRLNNLTGKLDIETTNGLIKGNIDSTKGITATTVNGSIRLNFGPQVSANIKADVVNGSVKIENLNFKNQSDKKDRKYFQGTLGNGGAEIKLETTNGSIRLTGNNSSTDI